MLIYADYDFYISEYLGQAIEAVNFDRCALRASQFIDYYTMGKAAKEAEIPVVKMCCCALAEQFNIISAAQAQSAEGKELKSQSVGSWSKTYSTGTELEDSARARLKDICREYLGATGLLYRGACGCVSSYD